MEIYPAVDIRGGRVASPVFGDDPVTAVASFVAAGARWVHLVDLDQAYGTGSNRELVRALLAGQPQVAVQVGGALGTEVAIDELLGWGASRVVIGCRAAADDPELLERLVHRHGPHRLAVAIDATDGRVTPRGGFGGKAAAPSGLAAETLARRAHSAGVRAAIYTDVRRDGSLAGPDIDGARRLAAVGLAVVASGGIASLDDLRAVRAGGLAGAVVGRALHEGRFTLSEALACVSV